LIEELKNNTGAGPYGLSEKGFQVAHNRKLELKRAQRDEYHTERQTQINLSLTKFTGYLVLVGILQVTMDLMNVDGYSLVVILFGIVVIMLLIQFYRDFGKDFFED